MMTTTERLHSLREATQLFPVPRGYETIRRWATDGVQRRDGHTVVLRTIFIGRVRFTSKEWIDNFLKELNPDAEPEE